MIRFLTGALIYFVLAVSGLAQVSVGLAWTASTDNTAVAGYNIYRDGIKIGTSPTTSFTDVNAAENTTYSYTVQAYDKAGNVSGTAQPAVILTGFKHGGGTGGGGDLAFSLPTGSTLKFMSPSGSDTNNGLTPATAWFSPNHPMNCGEVILASPGDYTAFQFTSTRSDAGWGEVSNCPSTTGGIDGTGGIWFATVVCAGSDLVACNIKDNGWGNPTSLVLWQGVEGTSTTTGHNWAVSGFNIFAGTGGNCFASGGCFGFQVRVCPNNQPNPYFISHHLASINNVISNTMQAWGSNDCGSLGGVHDAFGDYIAIVGTIAQNSNNWGQRSGAIAFTALGSIDTGPGTHVFMNNNYGINNQCPPCVGNGTGGSGFDGEFLYIDSPDAHLFTGQAVISNNIGYLSTRECIALTYNIYTPPPVGGEIFKIYNNTCFNNDVGPGATEFDVSQIQLVSGCNPPRPPQLAPSAPWALVSVTNNISFFDHQKASTVNTPYLYALGSCGLIAGTQIVGGTGAENVLKSQVGPQSSTCDSSHNNPGSGSFQCACPNGGGDAVLLNSDTNCNVLFNSIQPDLRFMTVNFFTDPLFTNTAELLANRTGVPNCAGFENTTQCMGWNARTGTLTTPSVISDLTPTCGSNCTGKGFQRPSMTCAANADYPAWLKGIVYLHADSGFTAGTTITRKGGLVTIPCGL